MIWVAIRLMKLGIKVIQIMSILLEKWKIWRFIMIQLNKPSSINFYNDILLVEMTKSIFQELKWVEQVELLMLKFLQKQDRSRLSLQVGNHSECF